VARPQRASRWTSRLVATLGFLLVSCVVAASCSGGINVFSRAPERTVEAFCAQVKTVKDFDEVLASGDVGRIERQLDGLRTLREVSPPDIEAQVGTLLGITEELSKTVATAKDPDVAANEVFAKHQHDIAAITAAGQAVQTYSADKCQVPLNGTASGNGAGTTVPGTAAPGTSTTVKK